MEKQTGGPAFPKSIDDAFNGMTLRDYFAGQALMGALACQMGWDGNNDRKSSVMTAVMCYEYADEMLKVRDTKPTP